MRESLPCYFLLLLLSLQQFCYAGDEVHNSTLLDRDPHCIKLIASQERSSINQTRKLILLKLDSLEIILYQRRLMFDSLASQLREAEESSLLLAQHYKTMKDSLEILGFSLKKACSARLQEQSKMAQQLVLQASTEPNWLHILLAGGIGAAATTLIAVLIR